MELGNQANNHLEARLGAPLADKRADPLEARLIDGLEDELGDWLDDSSPGGLGAGPEPPEPPLNPASGEPDLLDPASPDTQARLEQIQRLWRKACQEQRHSLRTEARPGTRACCALAKRGGRPTARWWRSAGRSPGNRAWP